MIDEPEVALAFSPEAWFADLHRHLTDHGGARVRQVVMDPALAMGERYDTLVVSHRWPALTQHFVDEVHARGRSILGVYDPAEPASREYLFSLGADDVVANDASMSTILGVLIGLAPCPASGRAHVRDAADPSNVNGRGDGTVDSDPASSRLVVVGGPPGTGRSEVALALADSLTIRGARVLLADADDVGPSLGQRLGVPIEPNVRSAIEAVEHGVGDPARCVHPIAPRFDLLCGLPNAALWSQIRAGEVLDVIRALGAHYGFVVTDVASSLEEVDGGARSRFGIARAIVAEAAALVGVGTATPVGVSRLLGWVAAVRTLNSDATVHLIVNRSSRGSFHESEIEHEIRRTFAPSTLTFLPEDRKIDTAVWSAQLVDRGPFVRAVRRSLSEAVAGSRRDRRWGVRARRTGDLAAAPTS